MVGDVSNRCNTCVGDWRVIVFSFSGMISREEAESVLLNETIGAFLIRDSAARPGELSLSIKLFEGVTHVKVRQTEVLNDVVDIIMNQRNLFAQINIEWGLLSHTQAAV